MSDSGPKRQRLDHTDGDGNIDMEEAADWVDTEEAKLIKEGEANLQMIEMEKEMHLLGYNEEDYVVERQEWANCIHEHVAPKDLRRPQFKRPA